MRINTSMLICMHNVCCKISLCLGDSFLLLCIVMSLVLFQMSTADLDNESVSNPLLFFLYHLDFIIPSPITLLVILSPFPDE